MANLFPVYPDYKDVELGWLSAIPQQWQKKRLKYLGQTIIGLTYSPNDTVNEEEGVLVLRSSNIQNRKLAFSDNVYVNCQIPEKLVTQEEDILICVRNGSRALIGKNAQIDAQTAGVTFGAFMAIFRSDYNRYLSKVFNSELFDYQAGSFLTSTINQLTSGTLNNFEIPFPSPAEQIRIANFLDHETAKIDRLIEKQKELIDLLQEKRQAAISHAVTKGLNPDAPMKDSGVEWLGEVPDHWVISQFKFCTLVMQTGPFGSQLHAEDYVEGGYPLINPAHILNGELNPEPKCSVDKKTRKRLARHQLHAGDLILARRGELGRCAVVRAENEGWLCGTGSLKVVISPKLNPEYAQLLISSDGIKTELSLESKGATMDNLNTEVLGKVRVPVPPTVEQDELLEFVEEISDRYDKIEESAVLQVELLQERRTALISAAVTGKIDVRHWKAPESATEDAA